MQKRKSEITLFSLLMCVLVIFIHVTSWTLTAMDKTSVKYLCLLFPWRLSAFVVQGFVFLSGVRLFLSKKPVAYGKFLVGRVRRIVLPYLVWVAVYYAYFIDLGWYRFSWHDLAEYVFLGTVLPPDAAVAVAACPRGRAAALRRGCACDAFVQAVCALPLR